MDVQLYQKYIAFIAEVLSLLFLGFDQNLAETGCLFVGHYPENQRTHKGI